MVVTLHFLLAGPDRVDFASGMVSNGNHDIERRHVGLRKLIPALAAQWLAMTKRTRQFSRDRWYGAVGEVIGAERAETTVAQHVEHGLGHDVARGIAGAQEQYVAGTSDYALDLRRGLVCAVAISPCK